MVYAALNTISITYIYKTKQYYNIMEVLSLANLHMKVLSLARYKHLKVLRSCPNWQNNMFFVGKHNTDV